MNKLKSLKDKFITKCKEIKENHLISKFIKENKVFSCFVIVNLINATILRFMTMDSIITLLLPKPIIADLAVILILGSFSFLFKKNKSGVRYLAVLTFVFTLITTVNSIYYTYYSSFASFSMLSLTQFIAPVGDAVVQNVLQIKDLVYLIPTFVFYAYIIMKRKTYKHKITIKRKSKENFIKTIATGGITLLIFCITLSGIEISRFIKQWNKEYVVQRFGIYLYQINDGITSLQPKINSMFGYDSASKKFKDYFDKKMKQAEYTKENEYTNILKGKNIIVIHAESIQTIALNTSFNGIDVAPNFKRLASEGIYFSNYYSQVSVGTSSDAELTFNTSLMPTKSGTAFVSYSDRKYIATPSLLKEQGYYTFSMHGNTADFWNRRVMHKNFGFDKFYSKVDYNVTKDNTIGLGISDKDFFKQSVDYIEQISKEHEHYYGLLITLTNHTPFSETTKYGDYSVSLKEQVTKDDGTTEEVVYPYMEETKLGNYFKSVHYADEALGEFINELDQKGLLDNTAIVIYGDHDARLPKNEYEKLYNYDKENDDILDEEDPSYVKFDNYQYELNRKVPFIIWTKDKKYNTEITDVMGMYDAMPTLGNMLGIKNNYSLGHDIFNIRGNNIVVFPNGNWVTDRVYYNAQKGEYLSLTDEAIDKNYIEKKSDYAEELLDVSNDMIVFDLIKKGQDKK
ncbi:MAG: sulfatase-like hydrolase/transferase [Bacilli bacterium]|nr:sulfatase-like hydrolase/transferase [Bacilli bacterium]